MNRTRLIDFRLSRGPQSIGICQSDVAGCSQNVNAATQRLLLAREAGDTGWWGTWTKMAFNVDKDDPYITLPRDVARLINMDICREPVFIQNQFYEYLEYGVGLQDPDLPNNCRNRCRPLETFDRGIFPTFTDISEGSKLRVYSTDTRDIGKRVLIQGLDTNDNPLISLDGGDDVLGVYVVLSSPASFVDSPALNKVTGIQKDVTAGPVRFYEVVGGTETLVLTMEPSEQAAGYRRYFLSGLPKNCCDPTSDTETVQVSALAKLEFVPVRVDTDYLLIGNIEALIAECESIRYSSMDDLRAKQMSAERHTQAIRLLQGELVHQLGKERPAIRFSPFGSAHLNKQLIGRML